MTDTPWLVDVARRLSLPQGDFWQRLYLALPAWCLTSLMVGLVAFGSWKLVRHRVPSTWRWGTGRNVGWSDALAIAAFCFLIVAVYDGAGFVHGFFRQDDFSFLQAAREAENPGSTILLRHNDHTYPLYRLEVWLILRVAGTGADATTLAAWFNGVNCLTCAALLVSGCWVLHELGASRLSLLAFAFLTWTWPGWGEFTAGYYTLSAYVQLQALTFAALAAMLRGLQRGSRPWLGLSVLLLTLASSLDTSGVQAPLVLGVIGLAWSRYAPAASRRPAYMVGLLGFFVLACSLYFAASQHTSSARELVQNPSGFTLSLATVSQNLRQHLPAAGLALFSAPGGLVINLFAPTFLQLAAAGETVSPALHWCLVVMQVLATAGLAVTAPAALRRLSSQDRMLAIALGACALLSIALVLAARTSYATRVPLTLWHAKYLMLPTTWLILAFVLLADRLWLSRPGTAGKIPAVVCAVFVLGGWFVASCAHLERRLLPAPMVYVARGRWGNVRTAQARAGQYAAVMGDLRSIARQGDGHTVILPVPGAWASIFYARFTCLEWGTDYTQRGVAHLFWDLPSASPVDDLKGRWAPPEFFTSQMRVDLSRYEWLNGAFAPTPVSAVPPSRAPL